jgi:hypothetical protein
MELDALKELLTDLGLEWQDGGDESIFVMAVRGDGVEMPVLIKPGEEIELLSSIGSLPALGSKPIEATMRQLAAAMGCQLLLGPAIEEGLGRQVVLECRLTEETAWAAAEMTRQFELASRFLMLLCSPAEAGPEVVQ